MKYRLLLIALLWPFVLFAQNQEISIISVGDGDSKVDATNNALRQAIEQVYGAFVSSKTSVTNDVLAQDDIVSISQGSIKQYSIVSELEMPNNRFLVTVSAVVSPEAISKYTGHLYSNESAEFSVSKFFTLGRLNEMDKQAEKIALDHLFEKISHIDDLWTYSLSLNVYNVNPNAKSIDGKVYCHISPNGKAVFKIICDTFEKLSTRNVFSENSCWAFGKLYSFRNRYSWFERYNYASWNPEPEYLYRSLSRKDHVTPRYYLSPQFMISKLCDFVLENQNGNEIPCHKYFNYPDYFNKGNDVNKRCDISFWLKFLHSHWSKPSPWILKHHFTVIDAQCICVNIRINIDDIPNETERIFLRPISSKS